MHNNILGKKQSGKNTINQSDRYKSTGYKDVQLTQEQNG